MLEKYITDMLVNYGHIEHEFDGGAYTFNENIKKGFTIKDCYDIYMCDLKKLFGGLSIEAKVDIEKQKMALSSFLHDSRFTELSIGSRLEKMRINCRLAFGKVYERLAKDIAYNEFCKESIYNNSNGKNIIDLTFSGDKQVFDIGIMSNRYQKYVGIDVKYCTKFFNGQHIFYNSAFTKNKLYDIANFYKKQDNNYIKKSYLLAIVPTMPLTSDTYTKYKFKIDNISESFLDDFVFVIYMDELFDNGQLLNNNNCLIEMPKKMWKNTYQGEEKVYGINCLSPAVHTISEFVNDVL